MAPPKTIGSREVHAAIERLAAAIQARHRHTKDLLVLGIANGGIALARRLGARLGITRVGDLDISFHRDDIGNHPVPKEFTPTLLPGDVNGATVLLVDDVLFTGRTVKAALDELFDHGRPGTVELAVLVDRGDRRLPIVADFSGTEVKASEDEDVVVALHDNPANDRIEIRARKAGPRRAVANKWTWTRRHLITIEELSLLEIEQIHATASAFKKILQRNVKKVPVLRGKTIVNLFLEPSTRTRMAFDMAAKRLSADVISFDASSSSTQKGETLRDTAENIQALNADMIVIRHGAAGSPLYLSKILDIPVINAGDGAHEHPTQGLLDTFTMKEHLGSLKGRKVAILGDILFSRVARSNIHALTKMGAAVTLVGPATLVPRGFAALGAKVSHDLKSALADADVVMLLRIQHERQGHAHFPSLGEYTSMFGLNKTRASWLSPNAIIMHPGPINRGVEIDSDLADGDRSVILEQVTNGIAVRMAVLYLCAGYQPEHVIASTQ